MSHSVVHMQLRCRIDRVIELGLSIPCACLTLELDIRERVVGLQ